MFQATFVLGRLGRDPQRTVSKAGKPIAKFSVATDSFSGGSKYTEWHNIVCFGKLAENAVRYLKKGSVVFLIGKNQTTKWEDKNGETKRHTAIIALEVKFISTPGTSGGQQNGIYDFDSKSGLGVEPESKYSFDSASDFPTEDDNVPF